PRGAGRLGHHRAAPRRDPARGSDRVRRAHGAGPPAHTGAMQLIDTIDAFRKALDAERAAGRTVGLVPTMGYLHEGHASLMRAADADNDVVSATIFVNPLQFGAN